MSAVIVAIASEEDRVWKVSSEKKPHLTMLYLGEEISNEEALLVVEFLSHISSVSMHRFDLSVDRRGTLGEHDADVLFFDKRSLDHIAEVRTFLLANDTVRKLYLSAEQFEGWTPHLTLGYPETPAKPLDRENPITWVFFDKVALWLGDSDGPEFQLKDRYGMDAEVAMSESTSMEELAARGEETLAHYGVKGMRWGVRRASTGSSGSSSSSKVTKTKGGKMTGGGSSSKSSSGSKLTDERKAQLKTIGKVAVKSAAITGAAVAAGMVAGPVGSMTVSAIAKAADAGFQTTTIDRSGPAVPQGNLLIESVRN